MRAKLNILQRDLIGLQARVVKSTNPDSVSISGRVLDETRNTVTILHGNRKKVIIKSSTVFHFTLSDGTVVEVEGKVLLGRPENRIKKELRRRW